MDARKRMWWTSLRKGCERDWLKTRGEFGRRKRGEIKGKREGEGKLPSDVGVLRLEGAALFSVRAQGEVGGEIQTRDRQVASWLMKEERGGGLDK